MGAAPPSHAAMQYWVYLFSRACYYFAFCCQVFRINSILIILIIFIMLLNFNGLYWRRPPPPSIISRIRRNLFIHNCTILWKRISSSLYQHFKIPSSSLAERASHKVGIAIGVGEHESSPFCLIVSLLAVARGCVILAHTFSYLFLLFILISHHILP